MQDGVRSVEREGLRTIQIAAEAAREALEAEAATKIGLGAARDIAVAGDEQNVHEVILASCTASP